MSPEELDDDYDDEDAAAEAWEQVDREDKEREALKKTLPKEELERLKSIEERLAGGHQEEA